MKNCKYHWVPIFSNMFLMLQFGFHGVHVVYCRIWWRKGAKTQSSTGSGWKCIAGSLSKIAAGPAGVWGLDSKNQVFFRDGTAEDPDDVEGSGWTIVDGKFIALAVGEGVVWGLGG